LGIAVVHSQSGRMKTLLFALTFTACSVSASASGFVEKLSPESRRAAGLDKLSVEERAELERLIDLHQRGQLDAVRQEAAEKVAAAEAKGASAASRSADRDGGKRPAWITALITLKEAENAEKPEAVTSRLSGDYKGWSGRTTFRLENGQVWQQIDGTQRVDDPRPSPAVRVYPGMVGTYWLEVEGVRQRVKVKPIRLE
jgi:hypothetical protein